MLAKLGSIGRGVARSVVYLAVRRSRVPRDVSPTILNDQQKLQVEDVVGTVE